MLCSAPMTLTLAHKGKRLFFFLTTLTLLMSSLTSCGDSKEIIGGSLAGPGNTGTTQSFTINDFQIGESWGVRPITLQSIREENNFVISRMASNMAQVTTPFAKGTAFYLGKHNGDHLMATNAHVMKNIPSCRISPVVFRFTLFGITMTCKKIITIRRDVDFALLALNDSEVSEAYLRELNPMNLAFNKDVVKNTMLYSSGYGEFQNQSGKLTLKDDQDCRIYSATNTFRRLKDVGKLGAKKIPSIAIGCDISPGDSGSPVVDRTTGDVLGIVWSTQTPKPITMRSRTFLDELQAERDPDIWEHMAYAIPAQEIKQDLIRFINETRLSWPMRKRRKTVQSLLGLDF